MSTPESCGIVGMGACVRSIARTTIDVRGMMHREVLPPAPADRSLRPGHALLSLHFDMQLAGRERRMLVHRQGAAWFVGVDGIPLSSGHTPLECMRQGWSYLSGTRH